MFTQDCFAFGNQDVYFQLYQENAMQNTNTLNGEQPTSCTDGHLGVLPHAINCYIYKQTILYASLHNCLNNKPILTHSASLYSSV